MNKPRAIAFYLPQYHPIPENDAAYGKGFTEWTNVAKARPLFEGHYQPRLPADLGFYDLRLAEIREAQADLAREYGIHGFCYYHYWFKGERLLKRPFDEVLASGKPDFPFCLCWANENWSRKWDGGDQSIVKEQTYSEEDHLEHIQWLIQAFKDPRYIRIQNKPLMIIYRSSKIPDVTRMISLWRKEAEKAGIPGLFLCRAESFGDRQDPLGQGFDGAVEFSPHDLMDENCRIKKSFIEEVIDKLSTNKNLNFRKIYDYKTAVSNHLKKEQMTRNYPFFPSVMPSWDNTPRKSSDGALFLNASPEVYEQWLRRVVKSVKDKGEKDPFVFINAWNEWGEGNYLEPDQKFGRKYLEATRRAMQ